MRKFSELNIKRKTKILIGKKIEIDEVFDKEIRVIDYKIVDSIHPKMPGDKCLHMQIELEGKMHVIFTISKCLMEDIQQVAEDEFPFTTTIIKVHKAFRFT